MGAKDEIPPEKLAAAEIVYLQWLSENREIISDNGGDGNYAALLAALWATLKSVYR